MKKPVKLGLWLAGFVLLALLGLWLEHERAKARLDAFKAVLIAKGEKLSIADHVPKLPPALSNAAPDFIAAANRLTELKFEFQPMRMRLIAPGRALVTWQQAELPTDKDADIWPILTAHVEENRPLLAEMSTALERPEMVFNLDYTKGFSLLLPHLAKMKQATIFLANAALVDMRAEQHDSALTNLLLGVRLTRLNEEPIHISQLVRAVTGHIIQQTTWELMQHPGWNDQQLATLQRAWQEWDSSRGWLAAANMERALCTLTFAQCRANPSMMQLLGSGTASTSSGPFFEVLFSNPEAAAKQALEFSVNLGWTVWFSYADERWTLETQQVWMDGLRQASAGGALAPAQARMTAGLGPLGTPPMTMVLSRMVLGSPANSLMKFATFETSRQLTVTAIALHRHRLKHGKFPASLGTLVPEFLGEIPRDFMDGQPMRYQLRPDGHFLLWSVGADLKDDGGDPNPEHTSGSSSSYMYWLLRRDWVWPQAATEAEVAAYHAELAAKRALSAPKPPP